MALSIKNLEAERLARELARVTGESLTEAVTNALRDRLVREAGHKGDREQIRAEIRRIQARVAALPVRDDRTPEQIIGYDEHGLPS
ncbi:MAG: type II toxin-antitoxin system VapB family antitoxin [Gemmatimonadetes bacterium]|nr:type II toxin-antitoxin system VapB family antitoxin [Gemmatimonadota bacterium]